MKRSYYLAALLLMAFASVAFSQGPSPLITVAPISPITVVRGSKAPLQIDLHVNSGFHVNSNHPNDELLLPTVVRLDPPPGIVIGNLAYPEGEQLPLPFANDKLSVYSGDFEVSAELQVARSAPLGTQHIRGQVRYQACDNRRCFPPKTAPVEFDINVVQSKPNGHS